MRLEQLRYILEISKTKSFSIAAENLYVSQPALSRAIKALEEEFGIILFFRTNNGVSLTEIGKLLLPQMQSILLETNSLFKKIEDIKDIFPDTNLQASLVLQTLPSIADSLLPLTLDHFSSIFPNVEITIEMLDLSTPFTLTNLTKVDLSIVMNVDNILDKTIANNNLQIESLFLENLTAVVAHSHPLAKKNTIILDEALPYKLILHDNGFCEELFYNRLTNKNQKLNVILKSNNPRAITHLLIKQNAVLLTNNLLSQNDYSRNTNLKIIPLKNLKSNFIGIYSANNMNIHLLKEFISTLKFVQSTM